ncbi:Ubiquitin carboxyl-terminal hydrolase isozyme L3 [Actinomortierella ambigua]|uniref:Ubiquitin carboxyl-terminal hydrolase n=1 Tax=Actinomortierella ambigua TaxID=1343610 RepID=A0A9P6PVP0_9FUNG|nr:Ubiquitin carboxyl-terminal hydrolase isozyme L3 [Actinomortierella ambigua]
MTVPTPEKKIRWLALESNPSVLDKYVRDLGVKAPWRYVDVMGLDDELLAFIPQPVHAVILLFPINDAYQAYIKQERERIGQQGQVVSDKLVFYPQTIANACGTMGVLHSLANNWAHGGIVQLENGSVMHRFLEKTLPLSPADRVAALETDKDLARVHEGHASTGQTATPDLQAEVDLHFVCLVERDGHLYELDGNKPWPVNHGQTSPENFLKDAAAVAREFIARDPDNYNFSVIAATTAPDTGDDW